MQIRIISLKARAPDLVDALGRMFPHADVGVQQGIDLRSVSDRVLVASDAVTHSTLHALRYGRRWHHEVPTLGAVGLAQANRLALEEDVTQPLLLLEEDCLIRDKAAFVGQVEHLLQHATRFDLAVFGMKYRGKSQHVRAAAWLPDGFKLVADEFWLMHCVLYTPRGRERVAEILHRPLDMQIDSLYGSHARMGNLTVVGQLSRWTAVQSVHRSTIQTPLMVLNAKDYYCTASTMGALAVLVACYHWHRRTASHTP